MTVYTDDSNVKEWEDLTPDKINHIEFKGKRYDEVRYGQWIAVENDIDYYPFMCSECHETVIKKTNYCPRCGARMSECEVVSETGTPPEWGDRSWAFKGGASMDEVEK